MSDKKYAETSMYQIGKSFVELGEALMDQNTKVTTLVDLAGEAGLCLQFRLAPEADVKPHTDKEV